MMRQLKNLLFKALKGFLVRVLRHYAKPVDFKPGEKWFRYCHCFYFQRGND